MYNDSPEGLVHYNNICLRRAAFIHFIYNIIIIIFSFFLTMSLSLSLFYFMYIIIILYIISTCIRTVIIYIYLYRLPSRQTYNIQVTMVARFDPKSSNASARRDDDIF